MGAIITGSALGPVSPGIGIEMLYSLFVGGKGNACIEKKVPQCPVYFQIFSSPTVEEVKNQFAGFERITPSAGTRYLTEIVYGIIHATTTQNQWFGIADGKQVTINVIAVNTRHISIGFTNDFYKYSTLITEIIT